MNIKKGMMFTATINNTKCKGKIQKEDGSLYLCQDMVDGKDCKDKLGYKHSWYIANGSDDNLIMNDVKDLKLINRSIEDVMQGDRITSGSYAGRLVFGRCGDAVVVELGTGGMEWYSISQLKEYKYTIDPEEISTEATKDTKDMIDIDGKPFSKDTIKQALKEYCA